MERQTDRRPRQAGPRSVGKTAGNPHGGKDEPSDARSAALRVLTACRTRDAWADAALRSEQRLSPADAALCSRLVYGVLQNRLMLDYYLDAYCAQRVDHLQHPLPDILRLGAYQILFLDKVPDHAAVGESVELAKRSGRGRAAGLVNAVLRKLAQNKRSLPALPDGVPGLSVRYSHPLWLAERMAALLGIDEAARFLESNNDIPPVAVQVNTLRGTAETLVEELSAAGVAVTAHPWVPGCLELSGTGDVAALEPFREGKFFVQDPAARLVTLAAGIAPGQTVLDVCAAPGGKSFSTAIAMEDRGTIVACDLHENKLRRVREGAARLGITCISTETADGRQFREEWADRFDTVLVDAPCSGLGVIRKKPDIRYKDPAALSGLPDIQLSILTNAARYVRPGGTLAYSTCTVLPEENQGVTDMFLSEHPDFSKKPFSLPDGFPGEGTADGALTLWPQRHGTDGFYICVMGRAHE